MSCDSGHCVLSLTPLRRSFFFLFVNVLCVQFSLSVCLEPQCTSSCVITALVGASDLYQGQPSPAVVVSLGLNEALNAVSQPIRLSCRAQEMRLKNPGLNSTATCCFNQLRRHRSQMSCCNYLHL